MPQLIASVEGVDIKQVYLHQDRTSLGRRPNNDIILSDLAVSGNHCVFELKGLADVYVEDLGSTNGTYINGKMVRRQLLKDGDVMSIGKFKIQYLAANELMDEIKTAAMPLESSEAGLHASLKVLSGSSAGLEMPVVKAVTTFGKPGVAVVAIAHRRHGYFVSLVDGVQTPTVNGAPVNADGIHLRHQDVLDLAGTQMLFVLK